MFENYFMNGQAFGDVASVLANSQFDVNALRPYIGKDGRSYITVNGKAVPINNASTLRKDEWKQMDDTVLQISRYRLTGIADLESRGLVYNIGNGLGTTVMEYENISDMNLLKDGSGLSEWQQSGFDKFSQMRDFTISFNREKLEMTIEGIEDLPLSGTESFFEFDFFTNRRHAKTCAGPFQKIAKILKIDPRR